MSSGPVAVIDIGSNSIKVLIASRQKDGSLSALKLRTIDARISAGISQAAPRLSEEGMARGLEAIHSLLAEAARFSPVRVVLVATSAVRDAQNGPDFIARVRAATGHSIRLLSGGEEAGLIGRGLTCDPSLAGLRDFYVFDLGGGSLECLAFRDRRVFQAVSLQLGCVRLMEKFVADSAQRVAASLVPDIARHVREVFASSGFTFSLPAATVAVGTGGTLTTVRTILAAKTGRTLEETDPIITIAQLHEMFAWLGAMTLAERRQIAGLPPARADVFPTALSTMIALAGIGGLNAFLNSVYNLRWGLAAEVLDQ
jgi:exopolyphosphatase/guanosine-5'-triphosphate,3'-diphosphate pyrophosphatase